MKKTEINSRKFRDNSVNFNTLNSQTKYKNASNEMNSNENLITKKNMNEQLQKQQYLQQQKNQINSEISYNQLDQFDLKYNNNFSKPLNENIGQKIIDDKNNQSMANFQNKKFQGPTIMPEYYSQTNSINDNLNDRNLNKTSKNNNFNQNKMQKTLPAYSQLSIPNSLLYQEQQLRRNQTPPTSTLNNLKQSNTVNFYNQYHPSQFNSQYDPSSLMHISRQQFQNFQQSNPSLHASNQQHMQVNDPSISNPIKYDNNWTIGLPSERKSTSSSVLSHNPNAISTPMDQNKSGINSNQQHHNLTTNSFNLYSLINPQNQRITQPYQQNLLNQAVQNNKTFPSIQTSNYSNQKQQQLNYHQSKSKSLDAESFLNNESKFLD